MAQPPGAQGFQAAEEAVWRACPRCRADMRPSDVFLTLGNLSQLPCETRGSLGKPVALTAPCTRAPQVPTWAGLSGDEGAQWLGEDFKK